MRLIIAFCIFIFLLNSTFSQEKTDANIFGHILNNKTKEHIPYISIELKGTTIATASDNTGHYFIKNIPTGKYIVKASGLGFKVTEKEIQLSKNKSIEINFELDEDELMTDEVVVTANRNETNRKETPVIVNLITPELMENTNSVCLSQSLNYQTGLRVENDCQNCGFQQVRINGLEGPYSQILIDSRPIFSTLAGVYGIEQIPTSMIERVEIIRGGGSALFGSNAIAGTINIITKEPLYNSFSFSNNFSTLEGKTPDNTFQFNGAMVTEDRKAGVTVFGTVRNRKPYYNNEDDFSELGKIDQSTFGLRSYYKTSMYSKLSVEYHHIKEFRRGGNLFDLPPDETDITEQTEHTINGGGFDFLIFNRDLTRKLNIYSSLQAINRDSYYGAGKDQNAYGKTDDITAVSGFQFMNYFKKFLFLPSELTTGFEYSYGKMTDKMLGYGRIIDQKVNIGGAFIQNEWKNKNLSLLIGLRADKHNLIDNFVFSPRANVRYTLLNDYIFRLSYSTGYRPPQTFDEDLHVTAVGGNVVLMRLDPDLKPEYSQSISGSLDIIKTIGNVKFDFLIEGFYTKLKDAFVLQEAGRDSSSNIILERRNGPGANVKGINLELRIVPSRWLNLQAGFTFQKSEYESPYQWSEDSTVSLVDKILRSPDNYGYVSVSLNPIKPLSVAFTGTYTGSMLVPHFAGYIPSDRLETTENFFSLNMKISYNLKITDNYSMELYSGVENIFNSFQKDYDKGEYRDAGYVYGPFTPRTYFAGMKIGIL